MTDEHGPEKLPVGERTAEEIAREASEASDEHDGKRHFAKHPSESNELTFSELVELWHHQHNVALHKERLYVPSSLAVLVGTILGWANLSALVVGLAGTVSVGLFWYFTLIIDEFAKRQDRFVSAMEHVRPGVRALIFIPRPSDHGHRAKQGSAPTVQRRLRPIYFAVLAGVWVVLVLVKLYSWQ
jgi:hypothetical protein